MDIYSDILSANVWKLISRINMCEGSGLPCCHGFCWMKRIKHLRKKNDVMVKISERFLSELEIPFIPKKWYVIYLHKPTPSQRPKVLDVEVEPTLYVSLDHHWNFEWVRPIHI